MHRPAAGARRLEGRAEGLPRHAQRAGQERRREGEGFLARALGRVAAARAAGGREAIRARAAAAARGPAQLQGRVPAHRPARADDGALRAAELRLERGSETVPWYQGTIGRIDRAALPGRRAHLPPLAAARAARRSLVAQLSLARARLEVRRRPDARDGARGAARAGPDAGGSARAGDAAALLKHEERPLFVVPGKLRVNEPRPDELNRGRLKLNLSFTLPPGAYATLGGRRALCFAQESRRANAPVGRPWGRPLAGPRPAPPAAAPTPRVPDPGFLEKQRRRKQARAARRAGQTKKRPAGRPSLAGSRPASQV